MTGVASVQAVWLVGQWVKTAAESLANDKLTATERARIGELALSAAQWLEQRDEKLAKVAAAAKQRAFHDSIAHLPHAEKMARMLAGK